MNKSYYETDEIEKKTNLNMLLCFFMSVISPTSFFIFILGIGLLGCEMADNYRCSDGLNWDESTKTCNLKEDTSEKTDSGEETDTGEENDSSLDSVVEDISGLGEICSDDSGCVGYDAALCALNPLAPGEPGYCTLNNCASGQCTQGYKCCDCSNIGYNVACASDEDAASLEGFCSNCS